MSDDELSSKRISKACDQCRAKKIKCDGLDVCSKCLIKGIECTYNYVHKQRMRKNGSNVSKQKARRGRPRKVTTPAVFIRSDSCSTNHSAYALEDRLSRMEEMVKALVEKVSSQSFVKDDNVRMDATPANTPSALLNTITKQASDNSSISGITSLSASEKRDMSGTNVSVVYESGAFLQTSMFLLSPPGIKWIESTLKNPKPVSSIVAIIKFAAPFEKNLLSEWVDPIEQSKLNPLPKREIISVLFEYIKISILITRVVDMDYLERLFQDYCNYRDKLIPEPEFTYGEYLLMNSALLIGCTALIELMNTQPLSSHNFSMSDIRKVERDVFDNSIFYYHRCSVISHGIASVSGSVILAFYADAISLSRAAFLIGSTAIRQAQQLGLHRDESYRGLTPPERTMRLRIWWTIYIFDKEMCFRWGHSPVINDDDVSAPPLPGTEAFWSFNERTENKTRDRMVYDIQTMLDGMIETDALEDLDLYINADYGFIISDVYRTLLSANSVKLSSAETIIATRDSLFKDLETWRTTLPSKVRPRSKYDGDFRDDFADLKNDLSPRNICWLVMISSYNIRYHHLRMIIGRTTSHYLCELELKKPGLQLNPTHLKLGLESARSVLDVACLVDSRFGNYANYLIFYPFNAFLTICAYYIYTIADPPESMKRDLELLMKSVLTYFNPFSNDTRRNEKGWLFSAVAKCMLYLTIQSIEDRGVIVPTSPEFQSQCDMIFDPIRSFLEHNIKIDDLVLTVRNKMQLLDVRSRKFATLPVNFKSPPEFSSMDRSVANTPDSNDIPVSPMLNNEKTPSQLHAIASSTLAGHEIENENNDWNFEGAELFLQNMLNIPNYMMDFGIEK